jgi:hypothetical protein
VVQLLLLCVLGFWPWPYITVIFPLLLLQLGKVVQLLLLCVLGFWPWPYITVIFPLLLFLFLPIRIFLIPR